MAYTGIFSEANIKIKMTSNPINIMVPENYGSETNGKRLAVTEFLGETICSTAPSFLIIKTDFNGNFDQNSNRTSVVTMVPKTNVFGSVAQYYRADYERPDTLTMGGTGSFWLTVTNQNDVPIRLDDWGALYVSIRITNN